MGNIKTMNCQCVMRIPPKIYGMIDANTCHSSRVTWMLPLFSYDPRRYRLPDSDHPGDSVCKQWDDPFAYIAGSEKSASRIDKIWLGFYMDPAFGFRPFDEFCEHLPEFYKKCESEDIPILSRCAPEGITALDAKSYVGYRQDERIEKYHARAEKIGWKDKAPPLLTTMYYGTKKIVEDANLNYFYRNHSHPRNWIPVLTYCPNLRLCLSGFGSNAVWRNIASPEWSAENPIGLEWLSTVIKFTQHKNVYADISGLDIFNDDVYGAVREFLGFIHGGDEDYAHLKYKLIFGTDWYLTHLMELGGDGNYKAYCDKYRELFYEVDTTGKLWERVSLINPWNFYALDKKIKDIHAALEGCPDTDKEKLEMMWKVINGDVELGAGVNGEGLIKYVARINEDDPAPEIDVGAEWVSDLAAVEPDSEALSDNQIIDVYWSYGEAPYTPLDKLSDGDNACISKYYSDLNFHVVTKAGNDGKMTNAAVKYDGQIFDLDSVTVSNNEAVFEKVFEDYVPL